MRHAKGDTRHNPVLVLNASFEPIQIASLRRALVLIVKGSALVQHDTGRYIHGDMPWPSVIRLREYRKVPHLVKTLSRRNLLLRDEHTCQYCRKKFPPMQLTLDHVLPSSRGGRSTWDNLVAACGPCNRRKANMTPEEAGMALQRRPRPVTLHTARGILRSHGEHEKVWQKYLYYNNEGCRETVTVG